MLLNRGQLNTSSSIGTTTSAWLRSQTLYGFGDVIKADDFHSMAVGVLPDGGNAALDVPVRPGGRNHDRDSSPGRRRPPQAVEAGQAAGTDLAHLAPTLHGLSQRLDIARLAL